MKYFLRLCILGFVLFLIVSCGNSIDEIDNSIKPNAPVRSGDSQAMKDLKKNLTYMSTTEANGHIIDRYFSSIYSKNILPDYNNVSRIKSLTEYSTFDDHFYKIYDFDYKKEDVNSGKCNVSIINHPVGSCMNFVASEYVPHHCGSSIYHISNYDDRYNYNPDSNNSTHIFSEEDHNKTTYFYNQNNVALKVYTSYSMYAFDNSASNAKKVYPVEFYNYNYQERESCVHTFDGFPEFVFDAYSDTCFVLTIKVENKDVDVYCFDMDKETGVRLMTSYDDWYYDDKYRLTCKYDEFNNDDELINFVKSLEIYNQLPKIINIVGNCVLETYSSGCWVISLDNNSKPVFQKI